MFPKWLVRGYLVFLLRHRLAVSLVVALGTLFFLLYRPSIYPNFLDLYPPRHPYIRLYQKYRHMFGTANVLIIVVEVKDGTIFDRPETIQKVDRITVALLHDIPGVNGEQVLSITHPKVKTTLTAGSGIKVVPLTYPRIPETKEDLEFFKQKVYTTEGVHGFLVSEDDKATLITAGFWEEYFDLPTMWKKIQDLVHREEDEHTKIYVTGMPILFAYFMEAMPKMVPVFLATFLAMVVLLWFYFRTIQGVVIPIFSGVMSAVWGLGFAGMCGFNIDPLVLVVPALITARALSHSVQSMERYHEEYFRLRDKEKAIFKSYTELFPPAMVSILSDGLAILTIAVASIPIMQKLAYISSFWIISIFLSVVTLHPIILSYVRPPREVEHGGRRISDRLYNGACRGLIRLATGGFRWVVAISLMITMVLGIYYSRKLRVGDTTPGMALLNADHPYNVAWRKVNDKFVGASQLVIIAEGRQRGAIKDAGVLNQLDLFARFMSEQEGAGGSLTATTLLKKIFRTFHEGDPKWEILPTRNDHVSQLFFLLTANTRRGEMDRFFDMSYSNATITVFYRNYNHRIIMDSIARAKRYIAAHGMDNDKVRYRLAGGLLGVLAAVNEEVDWSYKVNISLILLTVLVLSTGTYWTYGGASALLLLGTAGWLWWIAKIPYPNVPLVAFAAYGLWNLKWILPALIVMTPSLIAQPLSEAVMYLFGIDFNIDSLPVAAVGIGIGIDYGYYMLSRILEEYELCRDFDLANRRAIESTGKAIIFTGTTLAAGVFFWLFFPMKFQAEMALLLIMLLGFHVLGALAVIPALVSLTKPHVLVAAGEARERAEAEARVGLGEERARAEAGRV